MRVTVSINNNLHHSNVSRAAYKSDKEKEMNGFQHSPLLGYRLENLAKGSLSTRDFPFCAERSATSSNVPRKVGNVLDLG